MGFNLGFKGLIVSVGVTSKGMMLDEDSANWSICL